MTPRHNTVSISTSKLSDGGVGCSFRKGFTPVADQVDARIQQRFDPFSAVS